jgi:2-polyprenyl-3-methyl-5-hydroxy-6-metoxy-1,4-benzoquinol methylase
VADVDADEQAADWDALWGAQPDLEDLNLEARSLRWRLQRQIVERHVGALEGLRVIELGGGRATNALLYAQRGARVTVLDRSPVALEQAETRFAAHGVAAELIEADVFALPDGIRGSFDVSASFGLCEHFLGERREGVVAAHLDLLRPGGVALLNVPNRLSPIYRLWMAKAKRRGTWVLGTEVPFSGREMQRLARACGGRPLRPIYCGGLGTLVSQGVNPVLAKLGVPSLPVTQRRIPVLDYLAYDLLVPVLRPVATAARR